MDIYQFNNAVDNDALQWSLMMPIISIYYTAYAIIQKTIITDHNLHNNVLFPVVSDVFSEVSECAVKTLGVLVSQ